MSDLWDDHAAWWQAGFTDGADPEYVEQILPLIESHLIDADRVDARRVLDVGTGEGQVARLLAGGGSTVIGMDPSSVQLAEAARRSRTTSPQPAGPAGREGRPGRAAFVRGLAGRLPFAPGAFDAVVACLVFEHIADMDEAVAEVARVLAPHGRLLLLLNHPLLQTPGSGWIDDRILDEQYWRVGPYLPEDETLEEVDKGVLIPFVHRPLSRYVNAMAANGLLVVRMEEPAPPPGFLGRAEEYRQAATIPRLLVLVAVKAGIEAPVAE